MMKFSALVLSILIFVFQTSGAENQPPTQTIVRSQKPSPGELLLAMSTEEKVGQLLLIGIHGLELDATNREKLRDLEPGGVILFGRNIKTADQVAKLLYDIQLEAVRQKVLPVFTAVDQEGGAVTRLKTWPPLPSAAAIGRAGDPDLAFKLALFTGQVLKTLGFNMNLAPVLDLADPHAKSFIGSRSYGEDAETVSRFGSAVIAGYASSGVLTVSKHFPGHGGAVADSHLQMPVVRRTLESLERSDLMPFVELAAQKRIPGVMIAHIAFPMIDRSETPATYSKVFLANYLRRDLAYDGLVMTDDLEMLGARGVKDPGERAVRAIEAGADILMVAWNPPSQKRAFSSLLAAVTSGRISRERLDQSVLRILTAKSDFQISEPFRRASPKELSVMMSHRELFSAIEHVVAKNLALSAVDQAAGLFDLDREYLIVSDDKVFAESFQHALQRRRIKWIGYSKHADPTVLAAHIQNYPKHFAIVFYAGSPNSVSILNRLPASIRQRLYVVTTEMPFQIRSAGDFRGAFFSYTKHPNLGGLFFKAVANDRLPASEGGSKWPQR